MDHWVAVVHPVAIFSKRTVWHADRARGLAPGAPSCHPDHKFVVREDYDCI
jgi:hypothetical protein